MGWDSGRHLEIMASGALPYFVDLEHLPTRTLVHYPRALLHAATALPGVHVPRARAAQTGRTAGSRDTETPGATPWYLDPSSFTLTSRLRAAEYIPLAAGGELGPLL